MTGEALFSTNANLQAVMSDFRIEHMMRRSQFVPWLNNLCKSLGLGDNR
jgi:hypothetical protein